MVVRCFTHSKGNGGNHDLQLPTSPVVLHLHPLLGRHASVVAVRRDLPLLLLQIKNQNTEVLILKSSLIYFWTCGMV